MVLAQSLTLWTSGCTLNCQHLPKVTTGKDMHELVQQNDFEGEQQRVSWPHLLQIYSLSCLSPTWPDNTYISVICINSMNLLCLFTTVNSLVSCPTHSHSLPKALLPSSATKLKPSVLILPPPSSSPSSRCTFLKSFSLSPASLDEITNLLSPSNSSTPPWFNFPLTLDCQHPFSHPFSPTYHQPSSSS